MSVMPSGIPSDISAPFAKEDWAGGVIKEHRCLSFGVQEPWSIETREEQVKTGIVFPERNAADSILWCFRLFG